MPTEQELFCAEIADLSASLPTCPEDAVPFIHRMFDLLINIAGCAPERNARNYVFVPEGTLASQFTTVGWGGLLPSPYAQPLLYVIRGCEVFLGVNNGDCDLLSGADWCALCTARVKQIAHLVYTPLDALANSGVYLPRPNAGEWTIEFNNGMPLAVGGQPRLDNPLLNVPAHCFQLDEGLHQIDVNVPTNIISSVSTDNGSVDTRLFDVTNNAQLVTQRGKVQSVSGVLGHFSTFVNLTAPTIFRVDTRVISITGTPVINSSLYDEVNIERIAG